MENLFYTLLFIAPLAYLLFDLKPFLKHFSHPTPIYGYFALVVAIALYFSSRFIFLYLEKVHFRSSFAAMVPEDHLYLSLFIVEFLLWSIISRLGRGTEGLTIIRISMLFMTEIIVLYPFAISLIAIIYMLTPGFLNN